MPETEIKIVQYQCSKCGYKWIPRKKGKPKVCPECKRTNWNDDKKA